MIESPIKTGFTVALDEYIPTTYPKVAGIYAILNTTSGKLYIGKSDNLRKRKVSHINDLRANRHNNILLTRAYQKYGESAFRFVVIHTCSVDELSKMEGYFVNKYDCCNPKIGYNLQPLDMEGNLLFTDQAKLGLERHYYEKRLRGDYSVTWDIVNSIRKDNNAGVRTPDISIRYGLKIAHVQAILTNTTWHNPQFKRVVHSNQYPLTTDQKYKIIDLSKSGLSGRKICHIMNLGRGTVGNFLRRNKNLLV